VRFFTATIFIYYPSMDRTDAYAVLHYLPVSNNVTSRNDFCYLQLVQ